MATVWMFFPFVVYFISLSHVEIFAKFENVALHKRAYQSSYFSNDSMPQHSASLAVDGETEQNGDNFIHTAVDQPYTWWEVDLGKLYFVHEVKIYFRTDSKRKRRVVQIYANTAVNSSNTGHLCGTVTVRMKQYVVNITCNVNASYVTVYQGRPEGSDRSTALDFVEAEVSGCELNVKYGSNCDKLCEKRHCFNTNSSCNVKTGKCDTAGCTAGWTGRDCTRACELNVKYGSNCDKLCEKRHCVNTNSSCDVHTGKCDTAGCTAGWTGTDCTQACKLNVTYGSNCDKLCKKRHCVNTHSSCDVQTGKCDTAGCTAGWIGTDCTQECSPGTYGKNCKSKCGNCIKKSCDGVSGNCKGGCAAGYEGKKCKTKCELKVKYGSNCDKLCEKRHCVNTQSSCDVQTGNCDTAGCTAGWTGTDCTQECSPGTYGKNCRSTCGKCINKPCDRSSGTCTGGCIAGYAGNRCNDECSPGTYGKNCISTCGNCINKTCDRFSGNCTGGCTAGYMGNQCKNECSPGTYGKNCKSKCGNCINKSCDKVSGTCKGGCAEGYSGNQCKNVSEEILTDTIIIIIIISCVTVLSAAAVILVIRVKRTRTKSKEPTVSFSKDQNIHSTTATTGPVAVNAVDVDAHASHRT